MGDCATQTIGFGTETALALEAAFDGGRLTSDGGLHWLSKMDPEMGLCEARSPGALRSGGRGVAAIGFSRSCANAFSR